ncbi:Nascent polypeptide-associated complex subunit alpha-like protein [Smittium mucronatum]|uniref:Nascent polypeptide-associated complex subunit alpha n=1 Tax=Smittium mucronatum TaxID=133383 RepID=A0A1R0GRK8_9FUNG|nr:Nascent polypeptide-associated complex subunit alpha-like protein [Smittium mucronatum]
MADVNFDALNAAAMKAGSKTEKKVRKAMEKQGLAPFPGITRVTMRRSRGAIFSINAPEVFKSTTSDTYIVFGEAKNDDAASRAQMEALQQMAMQAPPAAGSSSHDHTHDHDHDHTHDHDHDHSHEAVQAPAEPEEAVDSTGVSEEDISMVMKQANVSRSKAVKALKENDNDIVEAIMNLM